jgi:hypothetical protein
VAAPSAAADVRPLQPLKTGRPMRSPAYSAVAVVASLLLPVLASADSLHAKHAKPSRIWHGYGFLPGYRSPEVIERERLHYPTNWYGAPVYWYGGPGFYHGRWNGGSFGPCWIPTPIGLHWDCG